MADLYNNNTGENVTVPDDQVDELSQKGFVPAGTERTQIISPDGVEGTIDTVDLQDALQAGYKLNSPENRQVRDYVNQNSSPLGSSTSAAGALGNQLLGGVPELAEDYNSDPLALAKRDALQKANPISTALGGAAGFVGNAVALGGVGALAEKGVMAGAEETLEQIATKSLSQKLKEGAVKGAAYGTAEATPRTVTAILNDDPEYAVENLAAGVIGGGLLGGAGALLSKGAEVTSDALSNFSGKENIDRLAKKADIKTAKEFHLKSGKDISEDRLANQGAFLNEMLGKLKSSADLKEDFAKLATDAGEQLGTLTESADSMLFNDDASMQRAINAVGEQGVQELAATNPDGLNQLRYKDIGVEPQNLIEQLQAKLDQKFNTDLLINQDSKKEIQILITDVVNQSKKALESADTTNLKFGDAKSIIQKELDGRIYNPTTPQSAQVNKYFGIYARRIIDDKLAADLATHGDPQGLANMIADMRVSKLPAEQQPAAKTAALLDIQSKMAADPNYAQTELKNQVLSLHTKLKDNYDTLKRVSEKLKQYGVPKGREGIFNQSLDKLGEDLARGGVRGGIAGGLYGGPTGAVVGAVGYGAEQVIERLAVNLVKTRLSNTTLKIATGLNRLAESSIAEGKNKIIGAVSNAASLSAPGGLASLTAFQRFLDKPKQKTEDAFNDVSKVLTGLQANPTLTDTLLSSQYEEIQHYMPEIAKKLSGKTQEIINYLYKEMPKPESVPDPLDSKPFIPNPIEMSKFQRKVAIALNPNSIAQSIANNTLSQEEVDTLRDLYPGKYQDLQKAVIDTVVGKKGKLATSVKKGKINLFLGNTVTKLAVAPLQQNFTPAPATNNQPASSGGTKVNINPQQSMTQSEAVISSNR